MAEPSAHVQALEQQLTEEKARQKDTDVVQLPLLQRPANGAEQVAEHQLEAQVQQHANILNVPNSGLHVSHEVKAATLAVQRVDHDGINQTAATSEQVHTEREGDSEHDIVKLWQWVGDLQEDRDVVLLPLLQRLARAEHQLEAQVQQHANILNVPNSGLHDSNDHAAADRLSEGVPPSAVRTLTQAPAEIRLRPAVPGPTQAFANKQ